MRTKKVEVHILLGRLFAVTLANYRTALGNLETRAETSVVADELAFTYVLSAVQKARLNKQQSRYLLAKVDEVLAEEIPMILELEKKLLGPCGGLPHNWIKRARNDITRQ
jgi:hypothetical protein